MSSAAIQYRLWYNPKTKTNCNARSAPPERLPMFSLGHVCLQPWSTTKSKLVEQGCEISRTVEETQEPQCLPIQKIDQVTSKEIFKRTTRVRYAFRKD